MSVPAWKQAIIERRKKQEDEQKEKQAKEEAYLSSMPPWKRALFQKREKEKQQQQEKEKASGAVSRERSNSFRQRQQQLAQERDSHQQQRRSSSTSSTGGGWGRRATPPSSPHDRETPPPVSPGYGVSHTFFGSASSSSQQQKEHTPPKPASSKHVSVTILPGVDDVASQKVASVPHVIPHIVPSQKSKPGSSAVMSAATHWRKVVSNTKKSYENKPQSTEIPAWKKALLQRRKEKETKSEHPNSPKESEPPVPAPSLPIEKTPSPPEVFDEPDLGVSFRKDQKEKRVDPEPVSLLVMKRKPSPEEANTVAREPSLPLQRKASPVEQRLAEKAKYSPAPEDTPAPPQLKKTDPVRRPPPPVSVTQPRKTEPKPLSIGRKPSPVELVGAKSNGIERSSSPTGTRNRVSSVTSMSKSYENKAAPSNEAPSNEVATEQGRVSNHQPKLIPKRSAPAPPPPSTKTQPQRAPQQSSTPASRPPARRKSAPEVVNRNSSEPLTQSTAIQTEGVTHRAPVYKEVNEWANVSVKDPKFLSLPTWKQALIKRRRADVAKRMGRTTSIDDVLLSNGPVPSNEKLPWNPPEEKKHLASNQSSSNQGNVTALLGRFSDRRTPPLSPTSPTSPKPTVTISQPRSPSPSSGSVQSSSSRPAYTSSGVPPTSTSAHTRKSFTWTPGDDTMPDEALSDDSSEEGGEYAVTAIDDVSSDEEDSDRGSRGEEDAAPAVVLLRPPQAISSATRQPTNLNKKKNSILVISSRPKKRSLRRVAFSDTELITEHQYPKYDYSDYENIQEDNVSAGFSFSFWKSKVEVEEDDEQSGLSHRLHPSLRSPEPDPDTYRYSPSRDSVSPVSSPPPPAAASSSSSLHNYKPSILSSYGDSLQQSYTTAMENGTEYEEEEQEEEVDSGGLVATEGPSLSNFYASLSSDTAAMLW